jgi:hypothetical protein
MAGQRHVLRCRFCPNLRIWRNEASYARRFAGVLAALFWFPICLHLPCLANLVLLLPQSSARPCSSRLVVGRCGGYLCHPADHAESGSAESCSLCLPDLRPGSLSAMGGLSYGQNMTMLAPGLTKLCRQALACFIVNNFENRSGLKAALRN